MARKNLTDKEVIDKLIESYDREGSNTCSCGLCVSARRALRARGEPHKRKTKVDLKVEKAPIPEVPYKFTQAIKKLDFTQEQAEKFLSLLKGPKAVYGPGRFGREFAMDLFLRKLVNMKATPGRQDCGLAPHRATQSLISLNSLGRFIAEKLKELLEG